mmetsp:Transcript_4717/g.5215  ORF Transcript_4717/g.5215 Transcript_4717/m.5215 type:complete len:88 (-) Transcript_4717:332-595(-)
MLALTRQITKSSIRSYSTLSQPRKVGAFRGGFLGFLVGVTLTGTGSYYYLLEEYKQANNVVVADVVALQSSISNLEKHVKLLEESKK